VCRHRRRPFLEAHLVRIFFFVSVCCNLVPSSFLYTHSLSRRRHPKPLRLAMLEVITIDAEGDYRWDCPLLIFRDKLGLAPAGAWRTGDAWAEYLDQAGNDVLGVVLPLELEVEDDWSDGFHGLVLLEWLRYSASDPVSLAPTLTASWHPLQDVQKRHFEPLVFGNGCFFARLPDAMEGGNSQLRAFVHDVRGVGANNYRELKDNLKRFSYGRAESAEGLTHHDLANDFYAALRLWTGYQKALEDAAASRLKEAEANRAVKEMLSFVNRVRFSWQAGFEKKLRSPYFRQFCLSRRDVRIAPYPEVETGEDVVRLHALRGLSPDTRVLFVDDEFDRGLADVLLQTLFARPELGQLSFTTMGPSNNQWVYSETAVRGTRGVTKKDHWARMVCVKDINAAAAWLKFWGEANLFRPKSKKSPFVESFTESVDWAKEWGTFWGAGHAENYDPKDVLGYNTSSTLNLDKDLARPKSVNTFIILDLRLGLRVQDGNEVSRERDSKLFLKALKAERPDIPVLMMTASRQVNKYADLMPGAQDDESIYRPDGWLTKEAPDALIDDVNSSRAAQYLLDFFHLSALMNRWYRDSINWGQSVRSAYHEMWSSRHYEACLKSIEQRADEYINNLKDASFRQRNRGRKLLGSIQQDGKRYKYDIEDRLVARRVAVWALLMSASWLNDNPEWNVEGFLRTLSCLPVDTEIKYPSSVLNFKTDLYLSSYKPALMGMLMKEEYDWLERQEWPEDIREQFYRFIRLVRAREDA
jgi:hypothetical protein